MVSPYSPSLDLRLAIPSAPSVSTPAWRKEHPASESPSRAADHDEKPCSHVAAHESVAVPERKPAHENGQSSHLAIRDQGSQESGHELATGSVDSDAADIDATSTKVPKPWDSTRGVQGLSYLGRRVEFLRRRSKLLHDSYEECRRITALFSKTFYMGTTLLSPEKRKATWAVYTWCRRTDELVDGPRVHQRSASLSTVLDDWNARLEDIFYRGKARDSLDLVLIDVCANFPDMSITPFRDMISGMQMDVDQARFQTWEELYLYCYRVAGTVGLMTLPIMGTVKPGREGLHEASEAALALGIALQLTNILRDVGEDRLRGRIYLPLEDLDRFNYTPEDLMNCVLDSRYISLIKFEIARARRYYAKAQRGIPLLAPESRLPVQASLDMYSQILDVIEENGYDNFHRRAYISKRKKLATIPLSYLRIQDDPLSKTILRGAEWLYGKRGAK
jgi:phytoene synthase